MSGERVFDRDAVRRIARPNIINLHPMPYPCVRNPQIEGSLRVKCGDASGECVLTQPESGRWHCSRTLPSSPPSKPATPLAPVGQISVLCPRLQGTSLQPRTCMRLGPLLSMRKSQPQRRLLVSLLIHCRKGVGVLEGPRHHDDCLFVDFWRHSRTALASPWQRAHHLTHSLLPPPAVPLW